MRDMKTTVHPRANESLLNFTNKCISYTHTSSAAWETRQITSYTDDKSAAELGNSVGSGTSDAISAGEATEHNCGVATIQTNISIVL